MAMNKYKLAINRSTKAHEQSPHTSGKTKQIVLKTVSHSN